MPRCISAAAPPYASSLHSRKNRQKPTQWTSMSAGSWLQPSLLNDTLCLMWLILVRLVQTKRVFRPAELSRELNEPAAGGGPLTQPGTTCSTNIRLPPLTHSRGFQLRSRTALIITATAHRARPDGRQGRRRAPPPSPPPPPARLLVSP